MQSSRHLTASGAISSKASVDKGSIARQTRSRKRKHSETAEDSDEGTEPTFDILQCLPALLCRYVFSHLSGQELLEMSTVNREWNKFVGERPQIGKLRLALHTFKPELTRRAKSILMDSERQYQNICSDFIPKSSRFLLSFLAGRAGAWKSLTLVIEGAVDHDSLLKLFEIIEPTVEELTVSVFKTREESSLNNTNWTFPRLKSLDCCIPHHSNVLEYFSCTTSLVSFSLFLRSTGSTETRVDLQTLLRNNSNLKELNAPFGMLNVFEDLPDVRFKLEKLTVISVNDPRSVEPFLHFLKTQAGTLESLKIYVKLNQQLLEIILTMPRLTSFIAFSVSEDIRELPVNTKIASLEIGNSPPALFRAMAGLKHLKCCLIDDEILLLLAEINPDLESLDVYFFNVSRVPEGNIFPKIAEFKARRCHEDLRVPNGDTNFTKLVKKEMEQYFKFLRAISINLDSDSDE